MLYDVGLFKYEVPLRQLRYFHHFVLCFSLDSEIIAVVTSAGNLEKCIRTAEINLVL